MKYILLSFQQDNVPKTFRWKRGPFGVDVFGGGGRGVPVLSA